MMTTIRTIAKGTPLPTANADDTNTKSKSTTKNSFTSALRADLPLHKLQEADFVSSMAYYYGMHG